MQVSYDRLWRLLIDGRLRMHWKSMAATGTSILEKFEKKEPVSMDGLMKICQALNCNIGEMMDVLPVKGGTE